MAVVLSCLMEWHNLRTAAAIRQRSLAEGAIGDDEKWLSEVAF